MLKPQEMTVFSLNGKMFMGIYNQNEMPLTRVHLCLYITLLFTVVFASLIPRLAVFFMLLLV